MFEIQETEEFKIESIFKQRLADEDINDKTVNINITLS